MIKITDNNFPAHLHTALGLATFAKDSFDVPAGTQGLLFGHGQLNGEVKPINDRYYFVADGFHVIIESYHREFLDVFQPDANTALKRLQDAKNRRQKLVEARKRGFHTADESWALVGEVLTIERLQKEFNSAVARLA